MKSAKEKGFRFRDREIYEKHEMLMHNHFPGAGKMVEENAHG
jgi:hypothetical protein